MEARPGSWYWFLYTTNDIYSNPSGFLVCFLYIIAVPAASKVTLYLTHKDKECRTLDSNHDVEKIRVVGNCPKIDNSPDRKMSALNLLSALRLKKKYVKIVLVSFGGSITCLILKNKRKIS